MSSVLIVEDNQSLARSLLAFLRGRGLEVQHVDSVAAARQRLASESFDAFLLDVGLPDGSGLDLLERTGTQRAVVMTATPDLAAFAHSGVTHFVPKPFDLEHLFQALAKIVDA